jgi:hypothetical protein
MGHRAYCIRPRAAGEGNREGRNMEVEHARLLQQGWRLAIDGCYRKPEPGKITGLPGNDANTGTDLVAANFREARA